MLICMKYADLPFHEMSEETDLVAREQSTQPGPKCQHNKDEEEDRNHGLMLALQKRQKRVLIRLWLPLGETKK